MKKQKKQKKAIPSTFFVLLRKSTRKADYQMDKNGQKKCPKKDENRPNGPKRTKVGPNPPQIEQKRTKRTKKGPNIQCSPRKMSKKAQKVQEKYRGFLVTSTVLFKECTFFTKKSMKKHEKHGKVNKGFS